MQQRVKDICLDFCFCENKDFKFRASLQMLCETDHTYYITHISCVVGVCVCLFQREQTDRFTYIVLTQSLTCRGPGGQPASCGQSPVLLIAS